MEKIVIRSGVYGLRERGRVRPVSRGETAEVSEAEAARLVALGIAAYAEAADTPPAPPSGGGEPEDKQQDASGGKLPAEAVTKAAERIAEVTEDDPDAAEVKRLEHMTKTDLERMARDMGVDISGARNNHERAALIVAADASGGGEDAPELAAGDIVQ